MQNVNLKMHGSGEGVGGSYDKIDITGMGTITGDLQVNLMRIDGMGSVHGDLKANRLDVHGTLHVEGAGDVSELRNGGLVTFGSTLKGGRLVTEGRLNVAGSVEADSFESKGTFEITGVLHARMIEAAINDEPCTVDEMIADQIRVEQKGGSGLFKKLFAGKSTRLAVNRIVGKSVSLENTDAQFVRGQVVKVGPNCRIERVEYSQDLTVDESATVQERIKV